MEYMNKQTLSHLIDSAMHRIPADLVIFNCNIVDVYTGTIRKDSIAKDGLIVGFGDDYQGEEMIDAKGVRGSGAHRCPHTYRVFLHFSGGVCEDGRTEGDYYCDCGSPRDRQRVRAGGL